MVDVNRSAKTSIKTTTKTGVSNSRVESSLNGYKTSLTDFDNLTTDFGYDGFVRQVTVTDSRGSPRNVTTTAYIPGTKLVSTVTDAAGQTVEVYDYCTCGVMKWKRDAKGHYTRFSYNLRGQLEKQWGDGSVPVSYSYDSTYGDLTAMNTYRGGTDWDGSSWPSSPGTADTTTWAYDGPSGLLASKTDATSRSVTYTYNQRGQMATRTWARGIVTTYSYDSATGDLLSQTYSDSTPAVTHTYDRAGRVVSVTDTTGTRDMIYDPAKPWRLSAEALGDFYGSRVFTRLYGETGMLGRIRGFQLGANVGSNSELEQTFGYNSANGRLETVTSSRLGGTDSRTFRYAYLSNSSLLQSLAIDSGGGPGGHPFTITRTYEATRDVITSVEAKWSTTSMSKFAYTYDERRNRSSVVQSGDLFADYGDSTFRLFAYNGRGELTSDIGYLGSSTVDTSKPLPGRRHGYDYDTAGNRKWSDNTGVDTSPADGAYDLRNDYTTNALNQYVTKENNTISVSGTAGVDSNPSATNPSNGDTRVAIKGQAARAGRQGKYWSDEVIVANNDHVTTPHPWRGPLVVYTGKRDSGADHIRAETRMAEIPGRVQNFTYDDDGNLTSDGVYDYTWDAENRLTEVKTSTFSLAGTSPYQYRRVAFRYDYMGRRVQKRVLEGSSSAETEKSCKRYLYDGWSQIAEYAAAGGSATGGLVRSFTWGLDIAKSLTDAGGVGALLQIAEHIAGKAYFLSYDGNGNVSGVFDATAGSASSSCVASYEYSPYGELLRSEGYYAKENAMRFSTKPTDDETGLVYYGRRYYNPNQGRFLGRDPIQEEGGVHLYRFVSNNPIRYYDVLGEDQGPKDETVVMKPFVVTASTKGNFDPDQRNRQSSSTSNYSQADTNSGGSDVTVLDPVVVRANRVKEAADWAIDRFTKMPEDKKKILCEGWLSSDSTVRDSIYGTQVTKDGIEYHREHAFGFSTYENGSVHSVSRTGLLLGRDADGNWFELVPDSTQSDGYRAVPYGEGGQVSNYPTPPTYFVGGYSPPRSNDGSALTAAYSFHTHPNGTLATLSGSDTRNASGTARSFPSQPTLSGAFHGPSSTFNGDRGDGVEFSIPFDKLRTALGCDK